MTVKINETRKNMKIHKRVQQHFSALSESVRVSVAHSFWTETLADKCKKLIKVITSWRENKITSDYPRFYVTKAPKEPKVRTTHPSRLRTV